jgi:hypothetical protein
MQICATWIWAVILLSALQSRRSQKVLVTAHYAYVRTVFWQHIYRVIKKSRKRVKIFIGGCSSVHFSWINKHNFAVVVREATQGHVLLYHARASPSVVFNSRSARMYFSHVQRVFIVEHCLASRSLLTCQNEFRDTFSYPPVPKRLAIHSRDAGILHRIASNMKKEWMHATPNALDVCSTKYNIFFWFQYGLIFMK